MPEANLSPNPIKAGFDVRANLIEYCLIGSSAHGLHTEGQDDTDYMGVYVEPARIVLTGLEKKSHVTRSRPEGEPSGPGDIDETLYSLRHWTKLALGGNPTVLMMLFAPQVRDGTVAVRQAWFDAYRRNPEWFVSNRAREAFLGYARQQRERLEGRRPRDVTRLDLITAHGYDTKYAMHMLRLGIQGREFLTSGQIEMPMTGDAQALLKAVRAGHLTKEEVCRLALLEENAIKQLALPPAPNSGAVYESVMASTMNFWRGV